MSRGQASLWMVTASKLWQGQCRGFAELAASSELSTQGAQGIVLDILRASERPLRPSELWEKAEPLGLKSKQHMKKTLHQLKGMNKAAAKPLEEPKKGRVPFGWVIKGRARDKPRDAGSNPGAVKAAGSKQEQTQSGKASKQPADASQASRTEKEKKEQDSWWNRFV